MAYNRIINYLGSEPSHKEYTKHIYKRYSGLNRTAYNHDKYYTSMLQEERLFYSLIWKLCFDFMFLIMGTIRSLTRFQIGGIFITVVFFILIVFYTPIYMKKNYSPLNQF